ncbi:Phage transposase [Enterobacter asburiae]|uniref:Phage transposase n=1 Tax=Enterobacter asburiae TaxID=61645 RepID=A0A376FBE0_ENTAS|nr:Phage transposase [Enterobacter asburiae]
MTHVEAAKALREKFSANGHTWTPECYRQLTARYPKAYRKPHWMK